MQEEDQESSCIRRNQDESSDMTEVSMQIEEFKTGERAVDENEELSTVKNEDELELVGEKQDKKPIKSKSFRETLNI